jgi:hypothetical protein
MFSRMTGTSRTDRRDGANGWLISLRPVSFASFSDAKPGVEPGFAWVVDRSGRWTRNILLSSRDLVFAIRTMHHRRRRVIANQGVSHVPPSAGGAKCRSSSARLPSPIRQRDGQARGAYPPTIPVAPTTTIRDWFGGGAFMTGHAAPASRRRAGARQRATRRRSL